MVNIRTLFDVLGTAKELVGTARDLSVIPRESAKYDSSLAEIISLAVDKNYRSERIIHDAIFGSAREYDQSVLDIAEGLREAVYLAATDKDGAAPGLRDINRLAEYAPALGSLFNYEKLSPSTAGQLVYAMEDLNLPAEQLEDQILRFVKIIKDKKIGFENSFRWMPVIREEVKKLKADPIPADYSEQLARQKEQAPGFWDYLGERYKAFRNLGERIYVQAGNPWHTPVYSRLNSESGEKALKDNLDRMSPQQDNITQQEWLELKKNFASALQDALNAYGVSPDAVTEASERLETEFNNVAASGEDGVSAKEIEQAKNAVKRLRAKTIMQHRLNKPERSFWGVSPKKRTADKAQEGRGEWRERLWKYSNLSDEIRNRLNAFYCKASESLDLSGAAIQREKDALREELPLWFDQSTINSLLKDFEESRLFELKNRELREAVEKIRGSIPPKSELFAPSASLISEPRIAPATKKLSRESISKQLAGNKLSATADFSSSVLKSEAAPARWPWASGEARVFSDAPDSDNPSLRAAGFKAGQGNPLQNTLGNAAAWRSRVEQPAAQPGLRPGSHLPSGGIPGRPGRPGSDAQSGSGRTTIHYSPTFNLPESAAGLQAIVRQAAQMALVDFERLLQRSNQGKTRQEYGVV